VKVKKALILPAIVGVAAYFAGNALGTYLSERKKSDYLTIRAERTAGVVGSHLQLGIGDTLPDALLEDLSSQSVRLSKVLAEKTYLVAVLPTCETCLEEMSAIARVQAEKKATGPFVFVSSANPRLLADLRDSLHLDNQFLYDHKGKFLEPFGIDIFPMFFVVGENRRIEEVVLGELLPEEIEAAIGGTK